MADTKATNLEKQVKESHMSVNDAMDSLTTERNQLADQVSEGALKHSQLQEVCFHVVIFKSKLLPGILNIIAVNK